MNKQQVKIPPIPAKLPATRPQLPSQSAPSCSTALELQQLRQPMADPQSALLIQTQQAERDRSLISDFGSPDLAETPQNSEASHAPSSDQFPEEDAQLGSIEIFPSAQESLTLIIGAALLRSVLDRVVELYPPLWFMTVLLMIIPAAAAVYQSTFVPQSGFLWGMRLTLILIGLLLGRKE